MIWSSVCSSSKRKWLTADCHSGSFSDLELIVMASPIRPKRPVLSIPIAAVCSAVLATSPLAHAQYLAQGAGGKASTIRIGGSSTVFPIMKEAIRSFREAGNSTPIDLKETGTSDGFRRFCSGQLEIANASRPINSKELKACASNRIDFIELPIAFDALTIVVHPSNTWANQISTKELARLWGRQAQGKVDRWNEVNLDWPDRPIKLCGPGKDSGTYDYFNKAINGSLENSRQDYSSSEDDNVIVTGVSKDKNALGYFGFAYFVENKNAIRGVSVAGKDKVAVEPNPETIEKGSYTLARPLLIYVNKKATQKPEVKAFVEFLLKNASKLSKEVGYVPLKEAVYTDALKKFQAASSGAKQSH